MGHTIPRALILVECAGQDPWLAIEEKAQVPILKAMFQSTADLVWINGKSDSEGNSSLHPDIRLLRRQLKITGSSKGFFRKTARFLVSVFHVHALGEKRGRSFFYNRFQGHAPEKQGNRVTLPFPTQIHIAGWRTLETFRYVLEHYDFDFLVRLSSTCLIRPKELNKLLSELPAERVFGGVPMGFGVGTFMSGASTIFSRDVVEGVVKNEKHWIFSVYEDVALSLVIRKKKLAELHNFPRIELQNPRDIPSDIGDWKGIPVVRCKAESSTRSSEMVIQNMTAAYDFLHRNGE